MPLAKQCDELWISYAVATVDLQQQDICVGALAVVNQETGLSYRGGLVSTYRTGIVAKIVADGGEPRGH